MTWILTAAILSAVIPTASAVGTSASAAVLMDADSGRVLYEQNADARRSIASITKLMTALVALEATDDLERVVTVEDSFVGVEGSSMYLAAGEQVTMRELFYGLMLNSGNDAAVAIACITAGSVSAFTKRMNQKAKELGMTNTHFVNPHGLSEEGHYSSARDMAILASACLQDERLVTFASTKTVTIGSRTMRNHNKLLWQYDGCIGMKTGYTILAGRTLISAAVRDGQRLVAVTLNDSNDWEDHKALLDYGFSTYPRTVLFKAGERVAELPVTSSLTRFVPVTAASTVSYPLAEGEQVTAAYDLPESVEAPLKKGQAVGRIVYSLNGTKVAEVELVCGTSATKETQSQNKNPLNFLWRSKTAADWLWQLPASG